MGSKHKRHDSATSSSSDSEASQDRKRHKEHKKKDKHKKHKKHKKRSSRSQERDREHERLVKEAKKFLKQRLKSGDPEAAVAAAAAATPRDAAQQPQGPGSPYRGHIEPISADDYFAKNAEFAAWLRDERGKYFSEQTTEENRAAFDDFVREWNARRLPAALYRGDVPRGPGGGAARTSFSWGIKGAGGGLAASGAVGMAAALDEELNLKEQARAQALQERQRHKAEAKEWLEEAVPRLAGKDKALEEKRARRELSKAGNDSPEHVARGWDVMGGGEDSFAAAKAREAARQQQRERRQTAQQAGVAQRLAAVRAAEDEKMAAFRALVQQGPIQIAKRQG